MLGQPTQPEKQRPRQRAARKARAGAGGPYLHRPWLLKRRHSALSRRTAAEDTQYPRTTATRWLSNQHQQSLYIHTYVQATRLHFVHSFTPLMLPSRTCVGFRYKHILHRLWSVCWSTLKGTAARPISTTRASRQLRPARVGASAAPRWRHQYVTHTDADAPYESTI